LSDSSQLLQALLEPLVVDQRRLEALAATAEPSKAPTLGRGQVLGDGLM